MQRDSESTGFAASRFSILGLHSRVLKAHFFGGVSVLNIIEVPLIIQKHLIRGKILQLQFPAIIFEIKKK